MWRRRRSKREEDQKIIVSTGWCIWFIETLQRRELEKQKEGPLEGHKAIMMWNFITSQVRSLLVN